MTEKRAQYRKNKRKQDIKNLLKRAKNDKKDDESVNVNPEFKRNDKEKAKSSRKQYSEQQVEDIREQKANQLKKRLNWAIVIVCLLIIVVLVALFKF